MSKKIKVAGIANILYRLILMSLLLLLFVMVGIGSWENSGIPGFILFTGLTVAVFGPTVGGYAFLMALTGAQLLMDKKNPKKLLRNLLICKFSVMLILLISGIGMIYNVGVTLEWVGSLLILIIPQLLSMFLDLPAWLEKVEKNS